jgi:hypothetical protein
MPVDNRPVHAFWLVSQELLLQHGLGCRVFGEDHDSRGIPIDAMHDEGTAFVRSEMVADQVVHRWRFAPAIERHDQQARRLVHDQHRSVLENDPHVVGRSDGGGTASRAARPVRPHADDVPCGEPVSACPMPASAPFRKTFPRASASAARPRDPRHSRPARNLSSRVPAPSPPMVHCESVMQVAGTIMHRPKQLYLRSTWRLPILAEKRRGSLACGALSALNVVQSAMASVFNLDPAGTCQRPNWWPRQSRILSSHRQRGRRHGGVSYRSISASIDGQRSVQGLWRRKPFPFFSWRA